MLIAEVGDEVSIKEYINFFSHDSEKKPKGLLEVTL